MLAEVDRVDDVLQTEEVGLTPHDLLLTNAEPEVARDGVGIELTNRIEPTVGVGVADRDIKVAEVQIRAMVAIEIEVGTLLHHEREATTGSIDATATKRRGAGESDFLVVVVRATRKIDFEVLLQPLGVFKTHCDDLADAASCERTGAEERVETTEGQAFVLVVEHRTVGVRRAGGAIADTIAGDITHVLGNVVLRAYDRDEAELVEDAYVFVVQTRFNLQPLDPLAEKRLTRAYVGADGAGQGTVDFDVAAQPLDGNYGLRLRSAEREYRCQGCSKQACRLLHGFISHVFPHLTKL